MLLYLYINSFIVNNITLEHFNFQEIKIHVHFLIHTYNIICQYVVLYFCAFMYVETFISPSIVELLLKEMY